MLYEKWFQYAFLMVKVTRVDTTNRLVVLCAPNHNNHQSILHQYNGCDHVTLDMMMMMSSAIGIRMALSSIVSNGTKDTGCGMYVWFFFYCKRLEYLQWRGSLTQ